MEIIQIVAYSNNRAIGKDNRLLWHLADDMAFFKENTTEQTVLMGKNTYLSLPKKFRPLPNRLNIVISSQAPVEEYPNMIWFQNIETALANIENKTEKLYVIGGASIYKQTIDKTDTIYATEVDVNIEGDAFFPKLNPKDWRVETIKIVEKNENNEYDFRIKKYWR